MMKSAACASLLLLVAGCAGVDSQGASEEDSQTVGDAITSISDGDYTFKPVHSGKCLDVSSSSLADGARVQQWTCNGTSAQTFHVAYLGGGIFEITNTHSGKSLDVKDVSGDPGATLQQWGYGGGKNQQFQFYGDGTGNVVIAAHHTGFVLDVTHASKTSASSWG